MSVRRDYNFQDNVFSPQSTSIRQGDQTRRMIFSQGYDSVNMLQKKGDESFPQSNLGQDDRWMEIDFINQSNIALKANNISFLNKSDFKNTINHHRQSLPSADKLNQFEVQHGIFSPKAFLSPKETIRSYSNASPSSQLIQQKEYGYRFGANQFIKSKTTNIIKRSFTKADSSDSSPTKSNKFRKAKTQKFIDDQKTEIIQQSNSKEDSDTHKKVVTIQHRTKKSSDIKEGEQLKGFNQTWKSNGFFIIQKVRKFVLKMQNLSFIRRFNNQTLSQFQVINDLSAFYDPHMRGKIYKQRRCSKRMLISLNQTLQNSKLFQKIQQFVASKIKVLEPDQISIIIWFIIMTVTILLLLFFIPIFMAFQNEQYIFQFLLQYQRDIFRKLLYFFGLCVNNQLTSDIYQTT